MSGGPTPRIIKVLIKRSNNLLNVKSFVLFLFRKRKN